MENNKAIVIDFFLFLLSVPFLLIHLFLLLLGIPINYLSEELNTRWMIHVELIHVKVSVFFSCLLILINTKNTLGEQQDSFSLRSELMIWETLEKKLRG